MGHQQGAGAGQLHREVAVRDGVHAVAGDAGEAEVAALRSRRMANVVPARGGRSEGHHVRRAGRAGRGGRGRAPASRSRPGGGGRRGRAGPAGGGCIPGRGRWDRPGSAGTGPPAGRAARAGQLHAGVTRPEAEVGGDLVVPAAGVCRRRPRSSPPGVALLENLAQAQLDVAVDVLAQRDEAVEEGSRSRPARQQPALDRLGVRRGHQLQEASASIRTWPMLPATSWR